MKFTRDTLKDLRQKLNAVLDNVRSEHLSIEIGIISYEDHEATAKLVLRTIDSDTGNLFDPMRAAYLSECGYYGLKPEYLDKDFVYRGETHRIIGLNKRARKFPIIIKNTVTNKRYKVSPFIIAANFKKDVEAA